MPRRLAMMLALTALLGADAYAQAVIIDPARERIAEDRAAFSESNKRIRELIVRKLMGEDVCSERLRPIEYSVVCTPEGIFAWHDPDFTPRCQRCARYQNPFAYKMCVDGRIKGAPRAILVDPC